MPTVFTKLLAYFSGVTRSVDKIHYKFTAEFHGERILKIIKYLAKLWVKYSGTRFYSQWPIAQFLHYPAMLGRGLCIQQTNSNKYSKHVH